MSNTARKQHTRSVEHKPSPGPGSTRLPGIDGLYVLTAAGELGRFGPDGEFVEEPSLSESLSDITSALLHRYRGGRPDEVAIGLVTPKMPDKPWQCASLVFTDPALREIFKTSDDPRAPLTALQERNRVKSVYQGMELVLGTRKRSQTGHPRFCPVLFEPEDGDAALSRRYGVDAVRADQVLEVLNLMAPLSSEEQRHPALSRMVVEVLESRITPELRRGPELMLVENSGASDPVQGSGDWAMRGDPSQRNPWEDEPEQQQTGFNDGDPVTYWLLSWFTPFNELNDLQRQFVARGHTVTKKRAGTTLIERGSRTDVTLYLIEGTLELEAFDGRKMTIVGGTRRAHLPISQLRPHAYTVTAATNVTVIFVSQDLVREINRVTTTYKSRPGIEVVEGDGFPECDAARVPYEPGVDRY